MKSHSTSQPFLTSSPTFQVSVSMILAHGYVCVQASRLCGHCQVLVVIDGSMMTGWDGSDINVIFQSRQI